MVIPEGVEVIGDDWFSNTSVKKLTISSSVRELGARAFYECYELRTVIFAENG